MHRMVCTGCCHGMKQVADELVTVVLWEERCSGAQHTPLPVAEEECTARKQFQEL